MSKHGPIVAARMTWEECAAAGMTAREAAAHRGFLESSARDYAWRHNVKFAPQPRPSKIGNITREVLEPAWTNPRIKLQTIADRLGVSHSWLLARGYQLGLPKRTMVRKPIDDALFAYLWNYGVSATDLARYFGYKSINSPRDKALSLGLKPKARVYGKSTPTIAEALMARLASTTKKARA
jgi:hypothetical protein